MLKTRRKITLVYDKTSKTRRKITLLAPKPKNAQNEPPEVTSGHTWNVARGIWKGLNTHLHYKSIKIMLGVLPRDN